MSNFSSIRNLFSSRKTMAAANAPPVPKLEQAASVKQVLTSKQRKTAAKTRKKNSKSIFARIASPFKAIKTWAQIRKARTQIRKAQDKIKPIRKQIEKSMPDLKTNIPSKLQELLRAIAIKEIPEEYISEFSDFRGTFTDQKGRTTSSKSILTSQADKSREESAEALLEHLTKFCGGDKNQASTLRGLLIPLASTKIAGQLQIGSPKLYSRTTKREDVRMEVSMMEDKTARIVITQDYLSPIKYKSATVKTTIDVPLEDMSSITLDSIDITPKLTQMSFPGTKTR